MPAGTMVVYTPRDAAELEVCAFFFEQVEQAYRLDDYLGQLLAATTRPLGARPTGN
jgi:hypothetical protein